MAGQSHCRHSGLKYNPQILGEQQTVKKKEEGVILQSPKLLPIGKMESAASCHPSDTCLEMVIELLMNIPVLLW